MNLKYVPKLMQINFGAANGGNFVRRGLPQNTMRVCIGFSSYCVHWCSEPS